MSATQEQLEAIARVVLNTPSDFDVWLRCIAVAQALLDSGLVVLPQEKHPAMEALEELTPGGSEFVNNVEACIAYIKERLASGHKAKMDLVELRRQSVAAAAQETMNEMCEDVLRNAESYGAPLPAEMEAAVKRLNKDAGEIEAASTDGVLIQGETKKRFSADIRTVLAALQQATQQFAAQTREVMPLEKAAVSRRLFGV